MARCKMYKTCPFFNNKMVKMPALMDSLKQTFCEGNNFNCARYLISTAFGKNAVPDDLYPNQIERAERILQKKDLEKL